MIEVLQPGLLTTIQDLGRKGYEAHGMPPSGAFDPFLASIANKLVGNSPADPLLEFASTGPGLKFFRDCRVAITGTGVRYLSQKEVVPMFTAFPVSADQTLEFEAMDGWFGYLAISGSFVVPKMLGSYSTYLAAKMGTRLERGTKLSTGKTGGKYLTLSSNLLKLRTTNIVDILPALHTSAFTDMDRQFFGDQEYRILPQSNRMGIHLEGKAMKSLAIRRSAPVFPGIIQIPASGKPIILGPEGPTTGGYSQLAILTRASWSVLASTRPGKLIRFQWTDAEKARNEWNRRQYLLESNDGWEEVKS
jgi:Allophanate hydrolase subunit 2